MNKKEELQEAYSKIKQNIFFNSEEDNTYWINGRNYQMELDVLENHINSIPDNIGEFSDGYHTFNELYYQRLILFVTLVNTYSNVAWKSKKHEDGLECFGGGWFIVGIKTPLGDYTYHYELQDWDLFNCKELETSPKFDGHTCKDVTRLLSLVKPKKVKLSYIIERMENECGRKIFIDKLYEYVDYVLCFHEKNDNPYLIRKFGLVDIKNNKIQYIEEETIFQFKWLEELWKNGVTIIKDL